ncbi:MAG: cupin domain-containing protein [Prevotella sp.]|nr:cupin domain-containing protein [Prevotella sp.]
MAKVNDSTVYSAKELIGYESGKVVTKAVAETSSGAVMLRSADEGTVIPEHTVPFTAVVYVLDGEAEIRIDDKIFNPKAGEILVVPANHAHELKARKRFTVLLAKLPE